MIVSVSAMVSADVGVSVSVSVSVSVIVIVSVSAMVSADVGVSVSVRWHTLHVEPRHIELQCQYNCLTWYNSDSDNMAPAWLENGCKRTTLSFS